MSLHSVDIELDSIGKGTVKVNGVDLSTCAAGVSTRAVVGQHPEVSLRLHPCATRAKLEEAKLTLEIGACEDVGRAVSFLEAILKPNGRATFEDFRPHFEELFPRLFEEVAE